MFLRSLLVALFSVAFALGQNPSNQKVFDQASAALKSGDYAAAESGFRQVLKTDPRNIGVLGNLGVVYAHTHRYARAIEMYKLGTCSQPA